MLPDILHGTTIPVMEQVLRFTEARHGLLAGNIANIDTPGYQTRDLEPVEFQTRLAEAIAAQRRDDVLGGDLAAAQTPIQHVADHVHTILRHDGVDVGLEAQITEMTKNQMQHNLALAIMNSQFRLLQAAISEHL